MSARGDEIDQLLRAFEASLAESAALWPRMREYVDALNRDIFRVDAAIGASFRRIEALGEQMTADLESAPYDPAGDAEREADATRFNEAAARVKALFQDHAATATREKQRLQKALDRWEVERVIAG